EWHEDVTVVATGAENVRGVVRGAVDQWVRTALAVSDTDLRGFSLTAHPGLRVSGQLRFAGSRGPLTPGQLQRVRVNLSPVNGNDEAASAAIVSPDARVLIEGCLPRGYVVDVSVPGGGNSWTIASITSNGRDLTTQPLELDGDVSDLIITFIDQPT